MLGWVVDTAILGGIAWLLAGIASLAGMILQRWQSGNLRSYAAWLALRSCGPAVAHRCFLSFSRNFDFAIAIIKRH